MPRLLVLVGGLVFTGHGLAQFPGPSYPSYPSYPPTASGQFGPPTGGLNPNNLMPNIFNPQTQPLSPYLNLLRGGNPAANYYYGVRPGTIGMTPRGIGGAPFIAGGGNRTPFFPQLAVAPDPTGTAGDAGSVLPPAGHPVVFGNTLGFFPAPGIQAGGSRSALSGLGAVPAARRR